MIRVVSGRAIIKPMKPRRAPQTDRERRRMAGFNPIALPIIFGVMIISMIICTIINTATAERNIIQKFCPVSAAFNNDKKAVGTRAKV